MEVPRTQSAELDRSIFSVSARTSMSCTYIPRALRAGARLLPRCRVTRIRHARGRVRQVEAIVAEPGGARRIRIEPETVFVAAGAIQTPRLLRVSHITRNVGDRLVTHPMIKVAALFDEILDSHLAPLPVYQVTQFWPEITLGGSVFTPGFLALVLADQGQAPREIMRSWRRMAIYYAACRGSGRGNVRAVPFTGEALAQYWLSPADVARLTIGLDGLSRVLFSAGARRLFPAVRGVPVLEGEDDQRPRWADGITARSVRPTTVHVFCTCPLGESPDVGAADSFGRVHDFENLYLADASMIPDSPGVNPQGTVMALALRNARRFVGRGR
jgi:choline dehydrogenase-like flavoprotein